MTKTQVRPSRDLRNHYADIVKSLKEHNHIIITNNGVGESVLIGYEDYAMYEEYLHRRFIYEELQKSKSEVDAPNVELLDATEVFARIYRQIDEREV
jgi:prevent-host-death family protein